MKKRSKKKKSSWQVQAEVVPQEYCILPAITG